MRYSLFRIERDKPVTLQGQIRELLVSAMIADQLPPDAPVPSTRAMAKRLNVSRNTVMLAYQALAADGYLVAKERSGFYVSEETREMILNEQRKVSAFPKRSEREGVDWTHKIKVVPSSQRNIEKPHNWSEYPYPFIYGQVDADLFPISAWRDCMRQAMNRKWLKNLTDDRFGADDPMLIEQIQRRVLSRRGVLAKKEEILITVGAQNALYMLTNLLVTETTKVAIEDPGYRDIRNMTAIRTPLVTSVPVDSQGLIGQKLNDEEVLFVTPSHQYPTNVTMSMDRRHELLDWAERTDSIIIEDDYEFETNYTNEPTPALKSIDGSGRVIYVGSLSKSMMPGIRLGFVVAPEPLIKELRAFRKLVLRHPPGNNQRAVALFLAFGGHDALVNRLQRTYAKRWQTMQDALAKYFPGWAETPVFGGTSFWCQGPSSLDAKMLAEKALERGVVIEPGDVFFEDQSKGCNYFRLGFSSIADDKIDEGIRALHEAYQELAR